ncbi:uncharacterized protein N7477_000140 [Penicillium maclennaniae]|uniref:uncharacterized protein n=1 Tax=Penicillium maclennaniae TaxID=1343394 RepID=UPI002540AB73|nr:uncharacterized protein N7477_000140 [Penicillium maclennaniae]KAJ5683795.1 hypothetical protein N7477_000140 [Penicillium maclennaniae]
MSTPRKNDFSLARQNNHLHQSPFGHARESNYDFDLDAFPSKQNGTRSRHTFRTGTLAGAYRAASHASMSDDGAPLGSTPSPRRTREPFVQRSPLSETSNPLEGFTDVYRRLEEDGTIADHVIHDDWDAIPVARPRNRLNRREGSQSRDSGSHNGHSYSDAGLGLVDGTGDYPSHSPRRTTDYSRDEQRLRRVTGKDSPIFSKAKGGRAALTADNLQRREEQVEQDTFVSEDDGERGPSLNFPRTWGSRAARRHDWTRNVSGSSASDTQENTEHKENQKHAGYSKSKAEQTVASRSTAIDPTASRTALRNRSALGERNTNPHADEKTKNEQKSSLDQIAAPSNGAPIPNTPIVVYKNSTFTKPNTTKRDSQELLRKLSRAESPKLESMQTPEPVKLFERKIYDKTPRVTGAWIDTPVTERMAQIPSDLTKDILPPPASKEGDGPIQQTQPPANPPVEVEPKIEEPSPEPKKQQETVSDAEVNKRSRPPVLRPKLPKSGLETVMEDMKSGKEDLDLSDDTIEYLHAIMDGQTDLTEEEEAAAKEQEIVEGLQKGDPNSFPSVDMDRLHEKLSSLARNITEVKKGLNILRKDGLQKAAPGGSQFIPSDGRVYAAIPLPRLWKRNHVSGRRQLTMLGWVTFVSLSWYVIECSMCEAYSHPIFSDTCDGYCLRPDAPVFPFVTVTMLWRWSHLSTLLGPLITIGVAFFRLVAQLLGLWDGYVDEPQLGLGKLIGEIRINGTSVSFPWLSPPSTKNIAPAPPSIPPQEPRGPVWTPRNEAPARWEEDQPSMDDDEFL